MHEEECQVCGGTGMFHADYCERGWMPEETHRTRNILIGIGLGVFALVLAYAITACTPRSPTSPSECEGIQHCRDGMGTDTAGGAK